MPFRCAMRSLRFRARVLYKPPEHVFMPPRRAQRLRLYGYTVQGITSAPKSVTPFISRVIIGVTPFRVRITLLITYLLSPLPLQVDPKHFYKRTTSVGDTQERTGRDPSRFQGTLMRQESTWSLLLPTTTRQ